MSTEDYKAAKEAFVSGSNGGSVTRINSICLTALSTYALWTVLASHLSTRAYSVSWKTPASEFCILVLPLLLSLTVLSDYPIYLNALLITIVIVFKQTAPTFHPPLGSPIQQKTKRMKDVPDWEGGERIETKLFAKSFVTVWRAGMMLMTVICILAVDFKVFPREFSKAETWGTSLMDLGVGSFVFALGLICALPLLQSWRRRPFFSTLLTSIKRSAGVLALGIVRVLMVKGVEYPEHVTEYGVHWNFFFTLALVPILGAPFEWLSTKLDFAWMALLTSGLHQLALDKTSLQFWALTADRTDFLSQNREGIVSLPGYLAIYLFGLSTGLYVLPPDPYFFSRLHQPKSKSKLSSEEYKHKMAKAWKPKPGKLASVLASYALVWWGIYAAAGWMGWSVSRRLANLLYVIWITAFNVSFILGYLLIHMWASSSNTSTPTPGGEVDTAPAIFKAINRNGMVVFLAANLLTGLVNVSIKSMYASDGVAVIILLAYCAAVVGIAWLVRGRRLRI